MFLKGFVNDVSHRRQEPCPTVCANTGSHSDQNPGSKFDPKRDLSLIKFDPQMDLILIKILTPSLIFNGTSLWSKV